MLRWDELTHLFPKTLKLQRQQCHQIQNEGKLQENENSNDLKFFGPADTLTSGKSIWLMLLIPIACPKL